MRNAVRLKSRHSNDCCRKPKVGTTATVKDSERSYTAPRNVAQNLPSDCCGRRNRTYQYFVSSTLCLRAMELDKGLACCDRGRNLLNSERAKREPEVLATENGFCKVVYSGMKLYTETDRAENFPRVSPRLRGTQTKPKRAAHNVRWPSFRENTSKADTPQIERTVQSVHARAFPREN